MTDNQRNSYGYDFQHMQPIDTTEEALAAYDKGEAVYLLYPDNTEGMAENREEIENFIGLFGIEKEGENMNFKDLTECPFCGYDEYYGKYFTYGTVHMYSKYDGKFQSSANSEAYDNLITRKDSGRMYCGDCNRYLGNIYTNELSKSAERALKSAGTKRVMQAIAEVYNERMDAEIKELENIVIEKEE